MKQKRFFPGAKSCAAPVPPEGSQMPPTLIVPLRNLCPSSLQTVTKGFQD